MYFVKYGSNYLHDPRIDECKLFDLSFSGEENSCGYCDFTIYPDHPLHDSLKERDANNPIEVWDDDILLFTGFIYELGREFYLNGTVKCKGELDYLSESIVRPYSTLTRGYGSKAPNSVDGYFAWLIEQHNSQVAENKQFVVGINQGAALDNNNYLFRENDQYPSTIDEISEKLLNNDGLGGYLRVRHENGIRYIDYLSEWTDPNTQILDFGVNLTDYSQTDDAQDVATFVVPLGAKMSETAYSYNDGYFKTTDTTVNPEKEYYTKNEDGRYSQCNDLKAFESGVTYYEYNEENDESNLNLTIDGLGDCQYPELGYVAIGDMIYNEEAVSKYGFIGCTYKNEDLMLRQNLIDKGIIFLKDLMSPKRTIEIKAVDMHLVNPDFKPIRIGEYVRVRSNPHKLDSYFLCSSIDLDLNNPENSLYTLGTTYDTLTGQQNKRINKLNATINQKYEEAASITKSLSKMSDQARATVASALNAATIAAAESLEARQKADEATAKVTVTEQHVVEIREETKNAVDSANSAIAAANSANESANDAITSAGSAIATANAAQTEAAGAKSEAAQVRSDMVSQIKTITDTMSADYAKKTELSETESSLSSEISRSAAELSSAMEQQYSKKTELTSVEEALQSNIQQNASDISTAVASIERLDTSVNNAAQTASNAATAASNAKTAADTAQENADTANANLVLAQQHLTELQSQSDATDEQVAAAQEAVNLAQAAADAASTAASNAQAKANEAKTAADAAKKAADALGVRMTAAETDISQNSEQIELRATKLELQEAINSLTGSVSTLEVNAESIDGRVANTEGEITNMKQSADGFTWTVGMLDDISNAQTEAQNAFKAISDMNVGGQNLIEGSRFLTSEDCTFWSRGNMYILSVGATDSETVKRTPSGTYFECEIEGTESGCVMPGNQSYKGKLVVGDIYTYSCYLWLDTGTVIDKFGFEGGDVWGTIPEDYPHQEWFKVSVTFTCQSNASDKNLVVYVSNPNGMAYVAISSPMLVQGNKSTDWVLALTDLNNDILNAANTVKKFMDFTDAGLVIGDLVADTLGKNILISSDSMNIRDGETVIASFKAGGMRFDEPVVFKADGIMIDNGDAFVKLGENQILFEHATGVYMNANQSYNFTANLSRQLSGAVFAWCLYKNGVAQNDDWMYFFVPKNHVTKHGGTRVRMANAFLGVNKIIYLSNGGMTGHDQNDGSGTTNGIDWDNAKFVLRYVYGV